MLAESALVGLVPTTNFARAKAFYADQLGLSLQHDDGFALVFRAGGNMLRVVKVESLAPQPFTVLGWEVQDIHAAVTQLRERGVRFEQFPFMNAGEGVWTAPSGDRVAWFKDPDGNTLSLSQHIQ